MISMCLATFLFVALSSPADAPTGSAIAAHRADTDGEVTAAEAAPFLGEWTLALEGPNGPGTFGLVLRNEKEKVIGEISSEAIGTQPLKELSLVKKSLVSSYSFTWEGTPVDAVVSLTPGEDGKMAAQIDFAGGAYLMNGTAAKKDKGK
jgi:hypothetical protein